MERWKREHIRINLSTLVENTICNDQFLVKLTFLSGEESLDVGAKPHSMSKAILLYEIAIKRPEAYEILTKALLETKQTGVFRVFLTGLIEQGVQNPLAKVGIDEFDDKLYEALKGFEGCVLDCVVLFQGHEVVLRNLLDGNLNEINSILETLLDKKLLLQLVNNQQPILVKDSVPQKLNYYINIRLTSRCKIDPAIFDARCLDVFVIRRIHLHELRTLAKTQEIDVSSNQIEVLGARFILLEYEEDFEKICKIASTIPVHLLDHNAGQFTWVKSHGSIARIQEHVHSVQDELGEEEFIDLRMESAHPLCIADTPGMGKTALLANIAYKFQKKWPLRLMRFIVLGEFVPELQKRKKGAITQKLLVDLIAEQASDSEIGRHIVRSMLTSQSLTAELIFDGFDEVLPHQLVVAKTIFNNIGKWKSAHVFVATRPHMRKELEISIGTLSYNILPFGEDEQQHFLIKYWLNNGARNNERLTEFAKACLEKLKSNMNDSEREIAGIPLQCAMLAEVYAGEADKYSKPEIRVSSCDIRGLNINITSIFEMYHNLVQMRFKKIETIIKSQTSAIKAMFMGKSLLEKRKQDYTNAHIYEAIKLLFPQTADELETIQKRKLKMNELYTLGILEQKENSNEKISRFIHRTFAEYFIGLFIAQAFSTKISCCKNYQDRQTVCRFLFFELLSTNQESEPILASCKIGKCDQIQKCNFQYPVICYFINAHLKESRNYELEMEWIMGFENWYNVLSACVVHNFPTLFVQIIADSHKKLFLEYPARLSHLVILSAKHSSIELFRLVYNMLKFLDIKLGCLESVSPVFVIRPLHVAVERGNFQIADLLLNATDFKFHLKELKFLMHCCTAGSINDSKTTISRKAQIIQLLSIKNKTWINERLPDGTTPLLSTNMHNELLQLLIKSGADVNVTINHKNILHMLVESEIEPQIYHKILKNLFDSGFTRVNSHDIRKRTMFHLAVSKLELLPETVQLLHENEADFNAVDESNDSVLFYAVRAERSLNFVRTLIRFGANWKHRNLNNDGILHICAMLKNCNLLEYFLNIPEFELNLLTLKNMDGLTPFTQGLLLGSGLNISIINLMEKRGLEITKQLASESLMSLLCNKNIMAWELDNEFVKVADYLMTKGGTLVCKAGHSPWALETMKRNLQTIAKATEANKVLMENLVKRDALGANEAFINKSDMLYDTLQTFGTHYSFERLCVSLIACNQIKPFVLLKQCLQSDTHQTTMFVTPPNGLLEFMHSYKDRLAIIRSTDTELSITRLKDTINPELIVVQSSHSIEEVSNSSLIVLSCVTATRQLVDELVVRENKIIILCTNVYQCEDFLIFDDTVEWKDLSSDYQNEVMLRIRILINGKKYNYTDVFPDYSALKNELLLSFIREGELEFFEVCDTDSKEDVAYVSSTVFNYYLPDKFAFSGISKEELLEFAKFGHKIGHSKQNVNEFDYAIVENDEQFEEICKGVNVPVHKVKYYKGKFQLVCSKGSTAGIDKFIDKMSKNSKECDDFPVCTCGNHSVGSGNLIWTLFNVRNAKVTCWLSMLNFIPAFKMLTDNFKLGSATIPFDCELTVNFDSWKKLFVSKDFQNVRMKTHAVNPIKVVNELLEYLDCDNYEFEKLQQVAINTLFPNIGTAVTGGNLRKFVNARLLAYKNKDLVFVHSSLAWHFIAVFITAEKTQDHVNVQDLRDKILSNCFESYEVKIPFSNTGCSSKTIPSFKFLYSRLFKLLEIIVANTGYGSLAHFLVGHLETKLPSKWIIACLIDNHFNLLKSMVYFEAHGKLLQFEHVLLTAIIHADVPILELVSAEFCKHTQADVRNIILLFNRMSWDCDAISLLHLASLRGSYPVFHYLMIQHEFQNVLSKTEMRNLLHFCVQNTHLLVDQINDREKIIKMLVKTNSGLLYEKDWLGRTPLVVPNIHIDLILLLINLGADITAEYKHQNILHLSTRYLTPVEYHRMVHCLIAGTDDNVFYTRDESQDTVLHAAVKHLEILDSTIELLCSESLDLNATNYIQVSPFDDRVYKKTKQTVLGYAIQYFRSARVLKALIDAGADPYQLSYDGETLLQLADYFENLTAKRYIISRNSVN
ncbi:unnamed protein product [Orchesella dallaii]|uniref:NACHT domain-containing protein n=1 Tax=Orchesella dallaii TaxID=48710 RepID=A0ABP1S9W7_9HEXA